MTPDTEAFHSPKRSYAMAMKTDKGGRGQTGLSVGFPKTRGTLPGPSRSLYSR